MDKKIKLEEELGQKILMTRFIFQLHALRVPSFRAGDLGVVVMAWKGLKGLPRTFSCNETEAFQVRAGTGGEIEINRSIDIPIMSPSGEEWRDWLKVGDFDIHGEPLSPRSFFFSVTMLASDHGPNVVCKNCQYSLWTTKQCRATSAASRRRSRHTKSAQMRKPKNLAALLMIT